MEEDCGLFVVVTAVNRSRHLSNQYFVYCVNTLFLVFAQCNKPSSVVQDRSHTNTSSVSFSGVCYLVGQLSILNRLERFRRSSVELA